jgi:hypothetical protein
MISLRGRDPGLRHHTLDRGDLLGQVPASQLDLIVVAVEAAQPLRY